RSHVGGHILRALCKVDEAAPLLEESPCGFCGRSGRPECAVSIKILSRSMTISTNCVYQHPFRYGCANAGSDARPSCNVPVACGLCRKPAKKTDTQPAIWWYNMIEHLKDVHNEYAYPGNIDGLPLPLDVWISTEITAEEQRKLGIPVEKMIP
ncbi:hypothetical protein BV22DRAFT_987033, partial [Leucogyrophana mollusca]